MKKLQILLILLVVGLLFVPAVSGETIIDDVKSVYVFTGGSVSYPTGSGTTTSNGQVNAILLHNIEQRTSLPYIILTVDGNKKPEGEYDYTYSLNNGPSKPVKIYVTHQRNLLGTVTKTRFELFFDEWNVDGLTGDGIIKFNSVLFVSDYGKFRDTYTQGILAINPPSEGWNRLKTPYTMTISSVSVWQNSITVNTIPYDSYEVSLTRIIDGVSYASTITMFNGETEVFTNGDSKNFKTIYPTSDIDKIVITGGGQNYTYILQSENPQPLNNTVSVYVQNAQTGALIGPADLAINEYGTENWINSTLEWGWTTVELPIGNYEFYATADGFTQPYPGRLTVDGVDDNIVLLLVPTGLTPSAGNITMQFWVYDENNNGIPYAELSVTGNIGEGAGINSGIMKTNNQGFCTWEAPGNTSYHAYASKPGYVSGENWYTVTTASPVHIAIKLLGGEIPTNPTVSPTGVTPTVSPSPRPTEVAPGNSPIDNFILMFVNMGFDSGMALWLTGLFLICVAAVIGHLIAGKFGAMLAAPIGIVMTTGLGLIPFWGMVILLVIAALVIAKMVMR